jgi:hypothetical protein
MASRFINDHIFAGYENCHYTDNIYYARIAPFVNDKVIQQRGRFRIFICIVLRSTILKNKSTM